MALPELIKKKVEVALDNFSEKFIPQHMRDKVRLNYSFRSETVSLFEERPYFQDPAQWTSTPIAQFHFNSDDKTWSLYCADRNSKWHLYDQAKPSRQFNHLLRAVEHDPTGIFWG